MGKTPDSRNRARLAAAFAGLPTEHQQALEHDRRRRILRRLHQGGPQCLKDLAASTGSPLSVASYHTRVLASCGLVSRVASRPVRGAVENYFASDVRDNRRVLVVLRATEASDAAGR